MIHKNLKYWSEKLTFGKMCFFNFEKNPAKSNGLPKSIDLQRVQLHNAKSCQMKTLHMCRVECFIFRLKFVFKFRNENLLK